MELEVRGYMGDCDIFEMVLEVYSIAGQCDLGRFAGSDPCR